MSSASFWTGIKRVHFRAAGQFANVQRPSLNRDCLYTVIDKADSTPTTILVAGAGRQGNSIYLQISDVYGNEVITASGHVCDYVVKCNSVNIGLVRFDKPTKVYVLTTHNPYTTFESETRQVFERVFLPTKNKATGDLVSMVFCSSQSTVELKMYQQLSENEVKVILMEALMSCHFQQKLDTEPLPIIRISAATSTYLTPQVERVTHSSIDYLRQLDSQRIFVRAAGYNQQMKLMYFEVFNDTSRRVQVTLECNPPKHHPGFVKLVAKTNIGEELFTAVTFPDSNCLAIYGTDGQLMLYKQDKQVFDHTGRPLLTVNSLKNEHKTLTLKDPYNRRYDKRFEVLNYMTTSHGHTLLHGNWAGIQIFTPERYQGRKLLIIAVCDIAFAVQIYFEVYNIDTQPLPAICYRYAHENQNARYLLE